MKTRTLIFSILLLTGCQEETIQPTNECDCKEVHYRWDFVNGTMQQGWVLDYETNYFPDLCSKDNGEWIYYNNSNAKYKYVCN